VKQRQPWRWVYSDPRWQPLRQRVLAEEPFCWCGCGRPSVDVDHTLSVRDHPELAFVRTNLHGFAHGCHSRKTARDNDFGRRPNR
jgi:5-methylcytosine-specific restriction protein A